VLHTLVCKDSNTGEPKSSSMTTRLRCATNSLRSLIQKVRKGTGIRIYISAVYIVSVEGNVDVAKKILYMKARALRALVNHSLDHDPTIVILTFLSSHAQIFSRSHAGPSRAPFGKLPFAFLHSSSQSVFISVK